MNSVRAMGGLHRDALNTLGKRADAEDLQHGIHMVRNFNTLEITPSVKNLLSNHDKVAISSSYIDLTQMGTIHEPFGEDATREDIKLTLEKGQQSLVLNIHNYQPGKTNSVSVDLSSVKPPNPNLLTQFGRLESTVVELEKADHQLIDKAIEKARAQQEQPTKPRTYGQYWFNLLMGRTSN